ncbi:hypothetical protein HYH03_015098 [Edaphochlamys debaryana]|uniref:Uncharacterized protein n=1 Tax=Edaphochlamys debaryana TaxID=47281 RepID=A0A835XUU0_9CHLO|nr:hypothetical protein HYH03_015098 [Edaphochlamys debaryana]|eukprot:KAG2486274.1 hypothetical protein HYH03_015098 [Edaphochlamys debaryana]
MRAAVPLQGSGQVLDATVVTATHEALVAVRDKAPKRFVERLSKTPMQSSKHYYWWRAQSVAYMLRPNARIREELEKRRKLTAANPQPAPGCISIHVRHGDKGVEAETFEDKVYDITAAKVRALDPARFTDQLWLSTEDPATVEYFVNHTGSATTGTGIKWRTGYTAGVPRKPDRSKPNLQYMQEIGYFEEVMNALLNLDMACECSAFVGSIYSNWVRLIDEFRSTLRCKADAPFADVKYQDPHGMDVNW